MTTAAKRPAFQFYPGDWRRDLALRTCSIAARGLMIELMCIMHDGEPYGHLSIADAALTDDEAAAAVGVPLAEFRRLLAELERKRVVSRTDAGVLFSRRMVRDEQIRNARASGGHEGAAHGVKGAAHGAEGGRPRKAKGGSKTPLPRGDDPPITSHVEPPSYPPPAVAVASAAALTPIRLTSDHPLPASTPAAEPNALRAEHDELPPIRISAGLQSHYAELCAAALPHQRAALDALLRKTPMGDVLVGGIHAIATGLQPVRSKNGATQASIEHVLIALPEAAIKYFATDRAFDLRLFAGCVRDVVSRKPEPTPADQRATEQALRQHLPLLRFNESTTTTAEDERTAKHDRRAAMRKFWLDSGRPDKASQYDDVESEAA